MPPPPRPLPPPHTAHFTILGNVSGNPVANTGWVRNGNAQLPAQADLQAICVGILEAYKQTFLPELSRDFVLQQCALLYYLSTGAEEESVVGSNAIGGRAFGSLPLNVAACVGWRVQQHYRGGHPRMYLPAISTADVAGPRSLTSTKATALAAAGNSFHVSVNSQSSGAFSGTKLGIVSFVFRKEWRSPPVFRDFVSSSAHCDTRIDSMRRRLGHDIPP
jgi:hypothetical protein